MFTLFNLKLKNSLYQVYYTNHWWFWTWFCKGHQIHKIKLLATCKAGKLFIESNFCGIMKLCLPKKCGHLKFIGKKIRVKLNSFSASSNLHPFIILPLLCLQAYQAGLFDYSCVRSFYPFEGYPEILWSKYVYSFSPIPRKITKLSSIL